VEINGELGGLDEAKMAGNGKYSFVSQKGRGIMEENSLSRFFQLYKKVEIKT
jgi:hypothetical protein